MTQTNAASSVPVITIDGTSGVGKGTACSVVAQKLGWHILDSGSLYRLAALKTSRDANDNNLDQVVDYAKNLDVDYRPGDGELRVFLEGEDVTDQIRTEEVGAVASQIAAEPAIREALLLRQKAFAASPGLVADGRDMGTVVFPEAMFKFYLKATEQCRAQRRMEQLQQQGIYVSYEDILLSQRERW